MKDLELVLVVTPIGDADAIAEFNKRVPVNDTPMGEFHRWGNGDPCGFMFVYVDGNDWDIARDLMPPLSAVSTIPGLRLLVLATTSVQEHDGAVERTLVEFTVQDGAYKIAVDVPDEPTSIN